MSLEYLVCDGCGDYHGFATCKKGQTPKPLPPRGAMHRDTPEGSRLEIANAYAVGRLVDWEEPMIRSVSDNQAEILQGILTLSGIDRFDADITYGNGAFYKTIPEPIHKFDIDPQTDDTIQADSKHIPLPDESLRSIIYDPPFLTYIKQGRDHGSIMSKRFGGYWRYDELAADYQGTLFEAYKKLDRKGILVVKCQDIIHNHKLHPTHINIVEWGKECFRLKDLFILHKPHRMPLPEKAGEAKRVQQHARIHHSYFLVLEKR